MADEQDVAVGENRHDDYGAAVSYDVAGGLYAAGFADAVAAHAEDRAGVEDFAIEDFCAGS